VSLKKGKPVDIITIRFPKTTFEWKTDNSKMLTPFENLDVAHSNMPRMSKERSNALFVPFSSS
jgi:hypothetical protein